MSGGDLELEAQIPPRATAGVWAVKRHGRRPYAGPATAFAIEATAHTGGVPMAPPVVTAAGHGWTEMGGVTFRCHGWIDGATKQNEETSAAEAGAMGRIVARLHGLRIPAPESARLRLSFPSGGRTSLGWAAAPLGVSTR